MRLAIYHLPSSYDPQPLDIGSCYRRAYAETPSTSVGSHVTQWACSKEKIRHNIEGAKSLDSQCLQKLGNIFILHNSTPSFPCDIRSCELASAPSAKRANILHRGQNSYGPDTPTAS